jgi:toxin ParE1/3/4
VSRNVIQRAEAQEDLADAFAYIGQDSLDAALRFVQAAEKTFQQLAMMPGIGERFRTVRPELVDVRRIGISGFRKYQVYFRPTDDGIEVLRILHGARDIERIPLSPDNYHSEG